MTHVGVDAGKRERFTALASASLRDAEDHVLLHVLLAGEHVHEFKHFTAVHGVTPLKFS